VCFASYPSIYIAKKDILCAYEQNMGVIFIDTIPAILLSVVVYHGNILLNIPRVLFFLQFCKQEVYMVPIVARLVGI
jgi:hypothetical protein